MATQTQTQSKRERAGKRAAATRRRNAAGRSAAATRRSATQTGRSAKRTTRAASGAAAFSVEQLALQARRGVTIPVGAALEARDAVVRTARTATRRATRRRTLDRIERRGERALNWR
jgi:hypothetical protein